LLIASLALRSGVHQALCQAVWHAGATGVLRHVPAAVVLWWKTPVTPDLPGLLLAVPRDIVQGKNRQLPGFVHGPGLVVVTSGGAVRPPVMMAESHGMGFSAHPYF